jgi:hypothetical protein
LVALENAVDRDTQNVGDTFGLVGCHLPLAAFDLRKDARPDSGFNGKIYLGE